MKINPIKIKDNDIYIMKLKVDINDAYLRYYKIEVKFEDIPHIELVCKALNKLEKIYPPNTKKSIYNYPSGGGKNIGHTMEYVCNCNAKNNLIEGGLKNEDSFYVFDKYVRRKTFHTILQININDNNLFISDHWINCNVKNKIEKKKNLEK
jgi:hypothetical protein